MNANHSVMRNYAPNLSRVVFALLATALIAALLAAFSVRNAEAQTVTVDPTNLDFGSTTVGTTSGQLSLTITNNDTTPLVLSGLSITGPDASQFKLGTLPTVPLLQGESATVPVTFAPTTEGPKAATLSVGGQTVNLTGTGTKKKHHHRHHHHHR
jgi:hypothetical protein